MDLDHFPKEEIKGRWLLALAGSGLLAALLVAAGAEGESRDREGDDCSNLGDGHGMVRLLSELVALNQSTLLLRSLNR